MALVEMEMRVRFLKGCGNLSPLRLSFTYMEGFNKRGQKALNGHDKDRPSWGFEIIA